MLTSARALSVLGALVLAGATASAQCNLATLYATNNGGSAGGAVYFDLNVAASVRITQIDVNTTTTPATPIGLRVYTIPTTWVGQTGNPGAWTQVGQDNGTAVSAGSNLPSVVVLQNPIVLTPGSYGIALVALTFNHSYTNGNGANQTYSNACMTLTAGGATNTPFAAGPFSPRVWNGEIHANPATGLFASFSATNTSGATPLTTSFTDASYSSAPGGVTSWAWDLNGDSIIDSNAPNPSFTYSSCGYYDVTLTVNDGVNPPSTSTRNDFVLADPQLLVTPSFTTAGGGQALSIQFTDTSLGSPSSWSWDFDGDNVPDSVLQNPLWVYGAGGTYTVTLVASNACGGGTAQQQVNVIANDECVGALPLGLGLSQPYSTVGSSTSQAWPCAAGGNDIWFVYRATCQGTLEINTCTGTPYDSALEAFSGTCAGLASIVCNDDNCGLQSRISFAVTGGQNYYIRVGGFSNAVGTFQLNSTFTSSGSGAFATVFPGCGGATLVTSGTPNLGAAIGFTMTPATGLPFVMIGSIPLGVSICGAGCMIGHNMDVVLPGATFQATVPCWPFLVGGQIYFQGIDLGAAGGCPNGAPALLVTTDTVRATIG